MASSVSSATSAPTPPDAAAVQAKLKAAAAKKARLAKLNQHSTPAPAGAKGSEKTEAAATTQKPAEALRTLGNRESAGFSSGPSTPAANAQAAQTAYQGASKKG